MHLSPPVLAFGCLDYLDHRRACESEKRLTRRRSSAIGIAIPRSDVSSDTTAVSDALQVTHSLREVDIEGRPSDDEVALARQYARRRLVTTVTATAAASAVLTLFLPVVIVLVGVVSSALYAIVGSAVRARTAQVRTRKALGL